jgi:hypothetical protein
MTALSRHLNLASRHICHQHAHSTCFFAKSKQCELCRTQNLPGATSRWQATLDGPCASLHMPANEGGTKKGPDWEGKSWVRGLGGPGRPGKPSKIGRRFRPPSFGRVLLPPGAAQTPKIKECLSQSAPPCFCPPPMCRHLMLLSGGWVCEDRPRVQHMVCEALKPLSRSSTAEAAARTGCITASRVCLPKSRSQSTAPPAKKPLNAEAFETLKILCMVVSSGRPRGIEKQKHGRTDSTYFPGPAFTMRDASAQKTGRTSLGTPLSAVNALLTLSTRL